MSESKIELTKDKATQFNEWYTDIVMKTELLDYYAVSGCYIMLPFSYKMWEQIQHYVDQKLKLLGVDNVYFPLLIPETYLNKESSHIDGFTPEVVWVSKTGTEETNANNPSDNVRLCVRPTSETAIYPTFATKIRSHADMPLLWNQWCNVMRWEFSSPTPFIRSREFLWQEGHSAFKNRSDMYDNIKDILRLYRQVYEELLCVPVIIGKKVETEKFAGAEETFSIETFISDANKSIQCATAHNLGQKFSKMFDITFFTENAETDFVIQSSWGLTTRSIGTAIMTHSDNKGLVLAPYFAPVQIVIVPVTYTKDPEINEQILALSKLLFEDLSREFRVKLDNSDRRPGWKYYHWETKGVCLRIEIGPKDMSEHVITLVDRVSGTKSKVNLTEFNNEFVHNLFEQTCKQMLQSARNKIKITFVQDKNHIVNANAEKKLVLISLCDNKECDAHIRSYNVKPICRPIDVDTLEVIDKINSVCCVCGNEGKPCFLSKTF